MARKPRAKAADKKPPAKDTKKSAKTETEEIKRLKDTNSHLRRSNKSLKEKNEILRAENVELQDDLASYQMRVEAVEIARKEYNERLVNGHGGNISHAFARSERQPSAELPNATPPTDEGNSRGELNEAKGLNEVMRLQQGLGLQGMGLKAIGEMCRFHPDAEEEFLPDASHEQSIDQAHFNVDSSGVIHISRAGLERVSLLFQHGSQAMIRKKQREDKAAELFRSLRATFHQYGFFEYGHPSMLGLKEELESSTMILLEDLRDLLLCIQTSTIDDVAVLTDIMHTLRKTPTSTAGQESRIPQELTESLSRLVVALCGSYTTRTLEAFQKHALEGVSSLSRSRKLEEHVEHVLAGYKVLHQATEETRMPDQVVSPASRPRQDLESHFMDSF